MMNDLSSTPSWSGANWVWLKPDGQDNNTHLLFRKRFTVTGSVREARCIISANTVYELYVNGEWIGRGPIRSWPEWQYFDSYDLAGRLVDGENVIAVHAYHHGEEHVGVLTTCAGPGGLIAKVTIEAEKETCQAIGTDDSWRVLRAPQYAVDTPFVTWHREDYKERFDARCEPVGWESVPYDDSTWQPPRVLGAVPCPPWTRLIPNPLPPMSRDPFDPVNTFTHHSGSAYGFCEHDVVNPEAMMADNDEAATVEPVEKDFDVQIILDFGKPVVGRFHLDIADAEAGDVFVSYGDSLHLTRIDQLILRSGSQHYSPYERRFGRYVMLTLRNLAGPVRIRRVWFELAAYPVQPRGAFKCSDPMLNRIWEAGAWTVRMNMHDHFEDCPFREQLLYCGDMGVSTLLACYAFGDYALTRESLIKMARLQHDDGRIPNSGHVPKKGTKAIPEFPAAWLIALHNYWLHSGDVSLVNDLWPNVQRLLDWYAQWDDGNGLMRQLPAEQRADFVDNLAGIPMDGPVLAVQCFYLVALRLSERLASVIGDIETEQACGERKGRLAEAINTRFWDDKLQGYLSCLSGSGDGVTRVTPDLAPDRYMPLSQISNGMALFAGAVPEERLSATVATLLDPDRASPARSGYMSYYLVEGLFRCGRGDDAVRRIREYWGGMIERGATTFWEMFDPSTPAGREPERKTGWSLCHAFCAGPVFSLPAHVLGVEPLDAGCRRISVAPVPADLQWAGGRVPTPLGPVEVDWQLKENGRHLEITFTQPAGMGIELTIPKPAGKICSIALDGNDLGDRADPGTPIELQEETTAKTHRLIITTA